MDDLGRGAVAGAAAGVAWRAVEPSLRRLFGHPYSDAGLVTAFVAVRAFCGCAPVAAAAAIASNDHPYRGRSAILGSAAAARAAVSAAAASPVCCAT